MADITSVNVIMRRFTLGEGDKPDRLHVNFSGDLVTGGSIYANIIVVLPAGSILEDFSTARDQAIETAKGWFVEFAEKIGGADSS